MERARQVSAFWAWLPTFRAVAEVEHLGQAAASLGISSSAVSRTLSLLEEQLGVELLAREGRGLRLTPAGRLLQTAVRDAMRTVHEASERLEQSSLHGELRVSSIAPATETHLHVALDSLRRNHPGLRVSLTPVAVKDVRLALQQGKLDVALIRSPIKPEGISVVQLSAMRPHVYAPTLMRIPDRRRHSFESLKDLPFVAMTDRHGDDPYPLSQTRNVVLATDTFEEAHSAALALGALVVLPETMGRTSVRDGAMIPLKTPALRPIELCAAWRTPLALRTASDRLVEFLRQSPE